MEAKINVAEILKDKPQGTKLYDLLYNVDVELDTISTTDTETVVWCTNETDNNTTCHRGYSEFGTVRGCPDGLQILFPSKEMRDMSKFAWQKGDVLVSNDGKREVLFKTWENDSYTKFVGFHCLITNDNEEVEYDNGTTVFNTNDFKGTEAEDAAQTYINTIEERLGGKLNRETLEVEKPQPEFKDGDIVVYGKSVAICRKIYKHTLYFRVSIDETFGLLFDDNCASSEGYRFATDSEKQQLFDALAKVGKRWDAENKQIVDLPKKYEFMPFDRVICREGDNEVWEANLFSHYEDHSFYPFICVGRSYKQCIPYNDQTAHLLGTTDEWKEGEV